ncbi:MAG: hypothetical protein JNG82_05575 [Opitutaceae bacterium]|nr:hypothetical protein [Opitutaceae bacterium]
MKRPSFQFSRPLACHSERREESIRTPAGVNHPGCFAALSMTVAVIPTVSIGQSEIVNQKS